MARTAPALTALQRRAAEQAFPAVPRRCAVTGGSGFVGQRLVEMLVERGAEHVVSFDILPMPPKAWQDPRIATRPVTSEKVDEIMMKS